VRAVKELIRLPDAARYILKLVNGVLLGVHGFDFHALAFEGSRPMGREPRAGDEIEISRALGVKRFHYLRSVESVRGQAHFLEYHLPGRRLQ
jgi:hypothetical protein